MTKKSHFVDGFRANFNELDRAFRNGHVALVECRNAKAKRKLAVICALGHTGEEIDMVPFATMIEGNPYEKIEPPNPEGGFLPVPTK